MGGQTFLCRFMGKLFYMAVHQWSIMPTRRARFTNVFSIIQNTVNLKTLSKHGGIYTWRWSTEHSLELWKDLSLMLKTKRFQRSCQVQFPSCWPWTWYWYIIWRVTTTNRKLNLKNTLCILCLSVGHVKQSLSSILLF